MPASSLGGGHLLPSEQVAADFVAAIGVGRAGRVLDSISRRVDRRCYKMNETAIFPIARECVPRTSLEVELMRRLKLGLVLVDDRLSALGARKRILARVEKRKAERVNKRGKRYVEGIS